MQITEICIAEVFGIDRLLLDLNLNLSLRPLLLHGKQTHCVVGIVLEQRGYNAGENYERRSNLSVHPHP